MSNGIVNIAFRKEEEIGQHGFNSKVFKAQETNINRIIAIKQVDQRKLKKDFYKEACLLNLCKHPNVIDMYYAGETIDIDDNGEEYNAIVLAMPYYKNKSLQEVILNNTDSCKQLLKYTFGVLNGLLHIHSVGVLHLDIKPDNILISDRSEAIITDFGVSVEFEVKTSSSKQKKPLYAFISPPELFLDKVVSIQSDIYQIGILLYLLFFNVDLKKIAASYDFSDENRKNTLELIKQKILNGNLYEVVPNDKVPEEMVKIIKKCLMINPNDRYITVNEIINQMSKIKI